MKHLSLGIYTLSLLLLSLPAAAAGHNDHGADVADAGCEVPLFKGLEAAGSLGFDITISSEEARKYFNQGLLLSYGFNHDEARRSFRKAGELDPDCAMCFWGQALVLGPNINRPMPEAERLLAVEMITKARALLDDETRRERDYVAALENRYIGKAPADRMALDHAYARAMRELHEKYSSDVNAAILYAESLMDLTPWNYWTADGQYGLHTEKMIATLQNAIRQRPDHPGAHHLLIHVVEKVRPELAVASADRLRNMVPGAGHLQHMPAHIYIRVGRYGDAVTANLQAIGADKEYLEGCHVRGFYPMMYVPHNYDFLVTVAYLAGMSELALETAEQLQVYSDPWLQGDMSASMYDMQQFWSTPILAKVRFGKWPQILSVPKPDERLILAVANWHYARAAAHIGTGDLKAAEEEIARLSEIAGLPLLDAALLMGVNTAAHVFEIATLEARGLLAAKRGQYAEAEEHLRAAVSRQDALAYMEPPAWHRSERLVLGEVLLEAGKYIEAEKAFVGDLEKFPENGFGLYGLHQSLLKQERFKEAEEVMQRYRQAFREADVDLIH